MSREDIRIPCATMARIWAAAIEQTGEPALAMQLAIARLFAANRTTTLIMQSSSTVLEAFQLAAQYSVLIADVMTVELGEVDDTLYIEFAPKPEWAKQPAAVVRDCLSITYVAAVSSLQGLIGTRHPPTLLTFTFPAPPFVQTYYEVFDCSITFDAPANRIGFPAALKSHAVATGDPGLKAAIRGYADALRARFEGEPPLTRRVMDAIVERMSPQAPGLPEVARALGMSERSLQRRLKGEGQTWRGVLEQVRMDLSERYLREGTRSVDEIAYLSGYADTSSFVRAFKRAKGQPPRQYARGRALG